MSISTHVLYEYFTGFRFCQYGNGRRIHYIVFNKICWLNFSPTEATDKTGENFIPAKNTHTKFEPY